MNLREIIKKMTPTSKGSDAPTAEDAYLRGVHLLARRDHSIAELLGKLKAKGFPAEAAEEAIRRLCRQGFLDDTKFAARWVESALRNGRGYGTRLLLELQRKGVSRETARQAIAEAASENLAAQVLSTIAARRFSAFNPSVATPKERQRVYNYLQRRGFSLSAIIDYFRDYNTGVE